ncbi:MAG: peptide deformylase [Planctomycetes bacterium]|nr:peptide deformylase [Planctomycetota bacterium]MCB9868813.1 peptide deformylase [Planctomycetota bacterium]
MPIREILLLGDPRLTQVSRPVAVDEREQIAGLVTDLFDTMRRFREVHGWGRAIAAPQIGVPLRVACMTLDRPYTLINPILSEPSDERVEMWEDCMSFPELLVRISNPRSCRLTYRDPDWRERRAALEGDHAELVQHEVDHLDGVLAVARAIDGESFALRRAMPPRDLTLRGAFHELPDRE